MKHTPMRILSALLAAALLAPAMLPARAADSLQDALTAPSVPAATRAQTLVDQYGVTSVQYAVMTEGEITESGQAGVYSKTEDRTLTADTLYGIGSTSKMFTTAAVMKLVDAGKVDLDAPVTAYIPEFTMADARYKQITVRMLLNHSSGLMGSTLNDAFLYGDANNRDGYTTLLEDLKTQRLKADPGAFSVYCNDGFTLAEMIVERVSGQPFTEYIHNTFTQPLGMEHTVTPADDFAHSDIVRVYDTVDPTLELPEEMTHVFGTGGIYSTAEDLCRFGQVFTGESDILSDASRQATMNKEYLRGQWLEDHADSVGYGLGWDAVNQTPFDQYGMQALCKGGDTLAMHATLIVLPEQKISAAVLSSGGSSAYNTLVAVQLILEQLRQDGKIDEIKAPEPLAAPVKQALDRDFSSYEGLYANYGSLYRVFVDADDQLNLVNAYDLSAHEQLLYVGDGRFSDQNGIMTYRFLEQDGKTYLVISARSILPGVGETDTTQYFAQKLDTYALPKDIKSVWQARSGRAYVLVNAAYNAETLATLPISGFILDDTIGGYLVNAKIIDANNAQAAVEIPMMYGRDLYDYTFYTENGVEYFKAGDTVMMDTAAVPALYAGGSHAHLTIPANGYGRWFTIGEALDGKQLTVTLPTDCGFAAYDANGTRLNQSAVTGDNTVTLQAGGYIYFAGPAGTRIDMDFAAAPADAA